MAIYNYKEYNRKYRNKIPSKCKRCLKEFPRGTGKHFCSEECRKANRKEVDKRSNVKRYKQFEEYKLQKGCEVCGYNRCAACLDFHHVDPEKKNFRVNVDVFLSQKKEVQSEIEKCILVCKNCHYEIHHGYVDLKELV